MPRTKHLIQKAIIFSFVLIACGTNTISSMAKSPPYKIHKEERIDTHQYGYIDLTIDTKGHAVLTVKFSNGKKISGNTFYAVTRLMTKDKKQIRLFIQQKGLDGSWFGRAREGSVTDNFNLTTAELSKFDHIDVKFGTVNCGIKLVYMKNFTDWRFETHKCGS